MSSIFPGGSVFVARNAAKGTNTPSAYDTTTTQTDVLGAAENTTTYSVSGGAAIDAALTDGVWTDVVDKNFSVPTMCEFKAEAKIHHSPAPAIGVYLAVRVYIDEILQQERTITNASSATSTSTGALTIAHPDASFIASRIRIQFKRSGSMGTTLSSLSATVVKYTATRI